ncbi:sulfotransferase [Oscillatoria sp. CS-180]|uniref:sulfotransferase n=1 Tax=Oscillatoria sp. CS-180 TaxID=3021720 RepID=UPI00232CBA4C|nr:sulfotransferase [Oscillatoria sp. CS-180]MDB9526426.1 sulfotransferase [Oscillatoria sp. CS-180]
MNNSDTIKILFIAGFERSGSTIVNRVLGQIEGFVAWGELRDVWQHGLVEDRTCSCGKRFNQCPVWTDIIKSFFDAQQGKITPQEMIALSKLARNAFYLENFGLPLPRSVNLNVQKYLSQLENLYTAIQSKTNSRVIVDSTKAAWYATLLKESSKIDLYVLHLVRDPRGVCYSLQSRKMKGELASQWYNPIHASVTWRFKNVLSEKLSALESEQYLRLRYEDFIDRPSYYIELIMDFLKEGLSEPLFKENEKSLEMKVDHLFAGSPSSRFNQGVVNLKLDNRWKKELNPINKTLITNITKPQISEYGYLKGP